MLYYTCSILRVSKTMTPETKITAKGLFGNPVRVQLAHWIQTEAPASFSLKDAQIALSSEPSTAVRNEILKLEHFGLITDSGTHRQRIYSPESSSPFWKVFAEISTALGLSQSRPASATSH